MVFSEEIRRQILSGKLVDYKRYLAGDIRGYLTILSVKDGAYFVCVSANKKEDCGNASLDSFLKKEQKEKRKQLLDVTVFANRFTIVIRKAKHIPEQINGIMEPIYHYLSENGYVSGCSNCGACKTNARWLVNDDILFLCNDCAKQIRKSLSKKRKTEIRRSRFFPGLLGALFGALLGAVIWLMIFKTGYPDYCGLAGFAMSVLSFVGYRLAGGRLELKGVLSSIIVSSVLIYFTNRCVWTYEGYLGLQEYEWSFGEVYHQLHTILEGAEVIKSYYIQFIHGYFTAALPSIIFLRKTIRMKTGKNFVKKLK